jgi:hypothetical protein
VTVNSLGLRHHQYVGKYDSRLGAKRLDSETTHISAWAENTRSRLEVSARSIKEESDCYVIAQLCAKEEK